MMRHAVCTYQRIAFVATCDTIMLPNRNLMEKCLRETGSPAQVTYFVLNDMQGKPGAAAADAAQDRGDEGRGRRVGARLRCLVRRRLLGGLAGLLRLGLRLRARLGLRLGLLAARILGSADPAILEAMEEFQRDLRKMAMDKGAALKERLG